MRIRVLLGVGLLALSCACTTARPPDLPMITAAKYGSVHGTSLDRTQDVARILDGLAPRVPGLVPGCVERVVDLRLVEKMQHESWGGATYTVDDVRWMELPEGDDDPRLAATMAHELVHYLLGPDWSTLPGVLEEGLCDNVAHTLVPSAAALERAKYAIVLGTMLDGSYGFAGPRLIGTGSTATFGDELMAYTVRAPLDRTALPSFDDALRYDSSDLEPIQKQGVRGVLDALGYLLVNRIGIDSLYGLCLRARQQRLEKVPPEWLFLAAGLHDADHAQWRAAIDGLFGPAERVALLKNESLQFRRAP
jgi:hypothetical protein